MGQGHLFYVFYSIIYSVLFEEFYHTFIYMWIVYWLQAGEGIHGITCIFFFKVDHKLNGVVPYSETKRFRLTR